MKHLLSEGFILKFSSTFSNWFVYFPGHYFFQKHYRPRKKSQDFSSTEGPVEPLLISESQLNKTMSRHSVIYTDVQLTIYKRTCFNRLLSVAHSPFTAIVFVRLFGTVTVAENLQVEKIYKLNLYTCNSHTSPHWHHRDTLKVYMLYSVLSRLTIEADILKQYDNLWSVLRPGQIGPLHKPPNVCKVMCVYEWCAAAVTIVTAHVSLLGEPVAVCLQYAAWRPVSSSTGLYVLRRTALSGQ